MAAIATLDIDILGDCLTTLNQRPENALLIVSRRRTVPWGTGTPCASVITWLSQGADAISTILPLSLSNFFCSHRPSSRCRMIIPACACLGSDTGSKLFDET